MRCFHGLTGCQLELKRVPVAVAEEMTCKSPRERPNA